MANGLGQLLDNPAFQFGTALLGQSGWHDRPVSLGQQLGGALQQYQEYQQQAAWRDEVQRRREAQMARLEREAKLAQQRQKVIDRLSSLKDKDPTTAYQLMLQSGDPKLEEMGIAGLFGREEMEPFSPLGRLGADVRQGFVTPEQFEAVYRKQTHIAPPGSGGKFTKSDRIMELAGRMARGQASEEEREEYQLLTNADPFTRLMGQLGQLQPPAQEPTPAPSTQEPTPAPSTQGAGLGKITQPEKRVEQAVQALSAMSKGEALRALEQARQSTDMSHEEYQAIKQRLNLNPLTAIP